jgi:hypothetical protein
MVYEVFNLFLTVCIAISIPFLVKKTIDDKRAIKSFLTDEVKETLDCLLKIKGLIQDCYFSGIINDQNKDDIIRNFNELEIQINSLNEQLETSFNPESKKMINEIKEAYFKFDNFVTDDDLMSTHYTQIDSGFYREFIDQYSKLGLHLKKAIHKIHCY